MMRRHYQTLILLTSILLLSNHSYAQQARSAHIEMAKNTYLLMDDDLEDLRLSHSHTSKKSGITHFYYQQTLNGIDIRNANMDVHIKGGRVLKSGSSLIKNIKNKVQGKPLLKAEKALANAAKHVNFPLSHLPKRNQKKNTANQKTTFDHSNIALEPIETELVYISYHKKQLRLAWEVSLYELSGAHWWLVTLDAETGEVIEQRDRVLHCKFGHPTHIAESNHICHSEGLDFSEKTLKTNNSTADGSSYNVYPPRVESPNHGARTIITEPADADASPYGWHDVDGIAGAEYTITRGNNVHAYEDFDGSNLTIGSSPDGGASLDFDFPLNLNDTAKVYIDAATTNLFYWNNLMHDVWYHYGFDEGAGNYQANNYGNLGLAGDYVEAQAQDGSGTNNAIFSPGTDGTKGRMQMYLWNNIKITFTANGTTYEASGAEFGPTLHNVSGNLVIANDGSAEPTLACNPLTSVSATQMSGNIALIDRGSCGFSSKVANAQAAGAIAVVVCSDNDILPTQMGGTDGSIVIPSVLIRQSDCAVIRAQIPTMTVAFNAARGQSDADLDNGIIAHEYGHGISMRLTGGPSNSSCLNNQEQAGEGWSDWFSLVMTAKPNDFDTQRRGVGTYSMGQVTSGKGIRTYPYTTDMSVNLHTYDDIKNEALPHGVGSVWCAMIWDMYWNLVDMYGYDTDMYRGTGGNNIAMNLVMEGLKLQSCSPGFIDSRDAILLADQALYNGDNECLIWHTFARRGLGFSASQGSNLLRSDGREAFDVPPELIEQATIEKTADKTEAYPNDTITFTLNIKGNSCFDISNINITDDLPNGLNYLVGTASNGGTYNGTTLTWSSISLMLADSPDISYTYQVVVDSTYLAPARDTLFYDNMENGTGAWSISNASNLQNWTLTTNDNCGSIAAWHAVELEGITTTENQYLTLSLNAIGADAELVFNHWFNTEANWDGGTVEISDDGGSSWTDLEPYMTQNGYNNYIKNNPIDSAFAGSSEGCIETKIDLSDFSGANALIRFNFYYDYYEVGDGWYINDVSIISNDAVTNIAYLNSNQNNDSDYAGVEIITCTPIELYVNLEGNYDDALGEMTTTLNTEQGLLPGQTPDSNLVPPTPVGQPYNTAPWNYIGTEGAGWTDANYTSDVVDWVLVSLRENTAKTSQIKQSAGLLYKDGSIELFDKCLINTSLNKSSLHVVIEHRNHIGVMTPTLTKMSNGILRHDFRTAESYKDITSFGQKRLTAEVWGMYAGDIDQADIPSFDVNGKDKAPWETDNGKFSLYLPTDLNLDGDVNGADKALWELNNGISSRVPK